MFFFLAYLPSAIYINYGKIYNNTFINRSTCLPPKLTRQILPAQLYTLLFRKKNRSYRIIVCQLIVTARCTSHTSTQECTYRILKICGLQLTFFSCVIRQNTYMYNQIYPSSYIFTENSITAIGNMHYSCILFSCICSTQPSTHSILRCLYPILPIAHKTTL